MLVAGGYFMFKRSDGFLPFVYYAIAGVFALIHKGKETDMPPRLFTLPHLVLLSTVIVSVSFTFSCYFVDHSTPLFVFFWTLASILLGLQGYIGIKISETRPITIEAEAVLWLLKTSSNKNPAWFQKAVQIAEQSPNTRPLLAEEILSMLIPLFTPLPQNGQQAVTPEQEGYISALATLTDFEPRRNDFWRNEASMERPTLPKELIDRLEKLAASRAKCSHSKGDSRQKWIDGTARCPEACVNNAVEHILRLHESEKKEDEDKQDKTKTV